MCIRDSLIPELQGRFPIRVELDNLTQEDFLKILSEPKNSILIPKDLQKNLINFLDEVQLEAAKLNTTENMHIVNFCSFAIEELLSGFDARFREKKPPQKKSRDQFLDETFMDWNLPEMSDEEYNKFVEWVGKLKEQDLKKIVNSGQEVIAVCQELVCKENGLFLFNKAGDLVAENNDSRAENPDGSSWDIDADGVIPILVEALKEALTEIDTLKTKLAALESS